MFDHFGSNITDSHRIVPRVGLPTLYRVSRFQSNNHICSESHNRRVRRLARLKITLRYQLDRIGLISTIMALVCLPIRPSVCLFVCLSHSRFTPKRFNAEALVQRIEIPFAPYDRAMLDARFLYGSWVFLSVLGAKVVGPEKGAKQRRRQKWFPGADVFGPPEPWGRD